MNPNRKSKHVGVEDLNAPWCFFHQKVMPLYPSLTSIVLRNKAIRRTKRHIARIYPRVIRANASAKDQERFARLSERLDALYAEKVHIMRLRHFALVCAVCVGACV